MSVGAVFGSAVSSLTRRPANRTVRRFATIRQF
jgi:hypothetical protein